MDPDLFLAIALSQTLMDEKDTKTKEEMANVQKKTLEDLIDNLLQANSNLASIEPEEIFRFVKLVEKTSLSEPQLNAWISLLWILASKCNSLSPANFSETLASCLLQISLKKLEESVLKENMEKIRIQLVQIIDMICGSAVDRFAQSAAIEALKTGKEVILSTELPLAQTLSPTSRAPPMTSSSSTGKVEMQAFLQRVLYTSPVATTTTTEVGGAPPPPPPPPPGANSSYQKTSTSEPPQERGEGSRNYATLFVGGDLRGPSRLCSVCCNLLNSGLSTFNQMEQRLDFLLAVMECLTAMPVDPLSDISTVGWLVELMNVVLTISIAEQDRPKSKEGEAQFLVTKAHLKSILMVSQGRHGTNVNSLLVNLQLLITLQTLRHFSSKFHLADFLQASSRIPSAIEFSNHLWSTANLELIYMSLDNAESILMGHSSINTSPLKLPNTKSNVQQPSTIVSLGGGFTLDCAAQFSQKELSDALLKGLASSLLDSMFLLLVVSYIQVSPLNV